MVSPSAPAVISRQTMAIRRRTSEKAMVARVNIGPLRRRRGMARAPAPRKVTKRAGKIPIQGMTPNLIQSMAGGIGAQPEKGTVTEGDLPAESHDVPGLGQGDVKEDEDDHVQEEGMAVNKGQCNQGKEYHP